MSEEPNHFHYCKNCGWSYSWTSALSVESHAMEDYTAVSASRTKKEQVALAGAEVTERKMVDERVE